jgi:serine/threonine-protein kinase HipA
MSLPELTLLLGGIEAGRLLQDRHGRVRFIYADSWRESPAAYPLSLSMPLQAAEHGPARVDAWLWGLLPDNASILQRWATRFQVSARNAFALISEVGEDCAGAVQLVRPERIDAMRGDAKGRVEWLTEGGVAERLRALRTDPAAWRGPTDVGQFSLAGAQPKTALLYDRGRWGVPSGRIPTTHILKPPTGMFAGFPENEHLCLELARALGLPAAQSRVMHFGAETVIVVERYDRIRTTAGWARIHQEDLCQAAGIPPAKKYQNDGGPGARAIVELLRSHSTASAEDTNTFVMALGLNWLIAATDGHAKNYSLLIAPEGRVRLAPVYDVASVLPYSQFDMNRVKLAMKIGDKYRLRDIGRREWSKLARDAKLDTAELIENLMRMAQALPDLVTDIAHRATTAGLERATIERLTTRLIARSRACLNKLSLTSPVD